MPTSYTSEHNTQSTCQHWHLHVIAPIFVWTSGRNIAIWRPGQQHPLGMIKSCNGGPELAGPYNQPLDVSLTKHDLVSIVRSSWHCKVFDGSSKSCNEYWLGVRRWPASEFVKGFTERYNTLSTKSDRKMFDFRCTRGLWNYFWEDATFLPCTHEAGGHPSKPLHALTHVAARYPTGR